MLSYSLLEDAYAVPVKPKKRPALGQTGQSRNQNGLMTRPRIELAAPEMFTNETSQMSQLAQQEVLPTYSGRATDYVPFCKQYGICVPVEGFVSGQPARVDDGLLGVSQGQGQGQGQGQQRQGQTCGLNVPLYGPVDDPNARAQLDAALQATLNDNAGRLVAPMPMPPRVADMSVVRGYEDDELQSFLTSSSAQLYPVEPTGSMAITPTLVASPTPVANNITVHEKQESKPKKGSQGTYQTIINLDAIWDLFLFISAGILLIVILEQIFKLVSFIGMRKTLKLLGPLLANPIEAVTL